MLHDDRLLPSRTVLPQGFHLGGEGAGQTVEGVFVGLVSRQLIGWCNLVAEAKRQASPTILTTA
jgi:hypothetical protein